jgi:hypothetical protein
MKRIIVALALIVAGGIYVLRSPSPAPSTEQPSGVGASAASVRPATESRVAPPVVSAVAKPSVASPASATKLRPDPANRPQIDDRMTDAPQLPGRKLDPSQIAKIREIRERHDRETLLFLKNDLGLSDEQIADYQKAMEAFQTRSKSFLTEGGITPGTRFSDPSLIQGLQQISSDRTAAIQHLLTPDQYAKYTELKRQQSAELMKAMPPANLPPGPQVAH